MQIYTLGANLHFESLYRVVRVRVFYLSSTRVQS